MNLGLIDDLKKPASIHLATIFIAILCRLTMIYQVGFDSLEFGDAADYIHTARFICDEGSYPESSQLPFFRAPGLPFFISAITFCHPENLALVKVVFAVIDTLTVLCIFHLAWLLWADKKAALIAGLIAAVYPFFLKQVTEIQTEPLFMFFLTAAIMCVVKASIFPKARDLRYALAGGFLALAALTRPIGLIAIIFACFVILISQRKALRSAVKRCFALVGIAAIVIAPWAGFNYYRFGEIILVNDAGGYNVWRGTNPAMYDISRAGTPEEFAREARTFEEVVSPQAAKEVNAVAQTPLERSHEWIKKSICNLFEQPKRTFLILRGNALRYWRPWLNPQAYSIRLVYISAVMCLALYLLAFKGMLDLSRIKKGFVIVLLAYFATLWAVHIPFHVIMRIRIPITDPLLIVLASGAIKKLFRK